MNLIYIKCNRGIILFFTIKFAELDYVAQIIVMEQKIKLNLASVLGNQGPFCSACSNNSMFVDIVFKMNNFLCFKK